MTYKIEEIEGIGEKMGNTLRDAGVTTTAQLLKTAGDKAGRQHLAEKTGLSEKNILKWVNLADLCRINGVSTQYSELLEAAGVDTVKELASRSADNLATKMHEINESKKLVRQPPGAAAVAKWIDQAKGMEAGVSH